jgi:hypothetical protein
MDLRRKRSEDARGKWNETERSPGEKSSAITGSQDGRSCVNFNSYTKRPSKAHRRKLMTLLLTICFISQAFAFAPHSLRSKSLRFHRLRESVESQEAIEDCSSLAKSHLVFPGGGIFFYWQAGVVSYLREQGYDLDASTMAGASAGALTATLTASDVDFYEATSLALDLAEEEGVWDRRGGLQGVWGPMIERWLEEVLPSNVVDIVDGRVSCNNGCLLTSGSSTSLTVSLLLLVIVVGDARAFFWKIESERVCRQE